MPELPEVQAVVSALAPVLAGHTIAQVAQRRQDVASQHVITRSLKGKGLSLSPLLEGRKITAITRRAKRIVFSLDDGSAFYVHLGMTGRLTLDPQDELPHTHLTLHLSPPRGKTGAPGTGHRALHFSDPRRFGKVVHLPTGQHEDSLGPEPLDLPAATLHALLQATDRPVKPALLDQSLIVGLGNIYVDESLHAAQIHPQRKTTSLTLPEATKLNAEIQRILKTAIAHKGSTLRDYRDAEGNPGAFQHLHVVYDREGQPCKTCGTPIQRIVQSGRSTHFCPTCQPRKRPR